MEESIDRGRLGTYLNDHLAGATLGARLARRSAESNAKSEYGRALAALADEIEEDRKALQHVIAALELPENPFKKAAGWVAERLGTLKFNGSFTSYSPLSRLLELEGLLLGAMGKRCMWQTLELLAAEEPALSNFDFPALQSRAGRHVSRLGQLRLDARMPAFADDQPRGARPGVVHGRAAITSRAATYSGTDRRSGEERRRQHNAASVAAERRAGIERRSAGAALPGEP